jgi:hypothetical protein
MTIPVLFERFRALRPVGLSYGAAGAKRQGRGACASAATTLQNYGKYVILRQEAHMSKLVRGRTSAPVAASAFAKRFGFYRVQAQKAAVPISNHGEVTGYFVAKQEYENLRRLRDEVASIVPSLNRKSHTMQDMDTDFAQSLANARMDERLADLNALLDD